MIWRQPFSEDEWSVTPRKTRSPKPLPLAERVQLLREAGRALRLGRLADVRAILAEAGAAGASDAACLNLLGVLREARGEPAAAKACYGRAIRAERDFAPAQQNMGRLYDLDTRGSTTQPAAIGDPLTDLWLARRTGRRTGR